MLKFIYRGAQAAQKLFAPLRYLRVRHKEKVFFDFYFPALIVTLGALAIYIVPLSVAVFGGGGFINYGSSLLQVLVGFFIASLAAVATFQAPSMDKPMAGSPPVLDDKPLSRRRFLALLFGYLSFLSIALYIFGAAANLSAESVKAVLSGHVAIIVKWLFAAIYGFGLANLLTTTLLGLYYLSDRIHRHDPALERERPKLSAVSGLGSRGNEGAPSDSGNGTRN